MRAHGEGSIKNVGPNKYRLRYEGPTGPNGERRQVSETIHGVTKAQAGSILRDRIRSMETGTFVQPSKQTLGSFLNIWLIRHSQNITAKTASGYEFLFRKYVVPSIGSIAVQRLEPSHVRGVLDSIAAQGLSAKTAYLAHSALRRALADAVDDGLIISNPAGRVRAPRVRRKGPDTWTAEQIGRFLDAASESFFRGFFELAVLTGLRRSEITGLRWPNVELDGATARVVETLQRVDGKGLVQSKPKSERSRRVLALSSRAVQVLRDVRLRQLEWRMKAGTAWRETGYVFTDELGNPLDSGRASKEFLRVTRRAGLKGMTLHGLRHAHASLLISQGTHIKVVSERLGHASTAFTMDTYAHLLPGMQESAAEAIDKALSISRP